MEQEQNKFSVKIVISMIVVFSLVFSVFLYLNKDNDTFIEKIIKDNQKTENYKKAVSQYNISNIIICLYSDKDPESAVYTGSAILFSGGNVTTKVKGIIYPKNIIYKNDRIMTTDVIAKIPYNLSNKECFVYDVSTYKKVD